ncbi:MAG: TolC family protein [Bacteroidales bacterium]|nr:TolC family protein [Bacteroidales bacterium]
MRTFCCLISLLFCMRVVADPMGLTLEEAQRLASIYSLDAQIAKFNYMGDYWTYRSFKAELLPAVNLYGDLLNYNHSMEEVRNYDTGEIRYVDNNTLGNALTLSIEQAIPALGGTLSVQSYLYRLDQFDYDQKLYNSQPVRIQYTQPLRTYNELKWRKKTEPVAFDLAKREYLEAMEQVNINVAEYFFQVLSVQSEYKQALATLADRETLYKLAQKRFELTTLSKSELLQLELSLLNARVDVKNLQIELETARFTLFNYLRAIQYENVELIAPTEIPQILLEPGEVLQRALANSSHNMTNLLNTLTAEQNLAAVKAAKGIQLTLNGEVGFNKTAYHFSDAYRHLNNNQIVGLTLSLPIFDWGVSGGKVKIAQATLDVVKTEAEQLDEEFRQDVEKQVKVFNNQSAQWADAVRAREIAEERYQITMRQFENGSITVTELNTAQQELDAAVAQYISQLSTYWNAFYQIQKTTLHDYRTNIDINADFDALVK